MTSEVRVIKSKSVTTASTDNNAKRSVQQKCEEVDEQAVIKSSEQRRSEQKVNRKRRKSIISRSFWYKKMVAKINLSEQFVPIKEPTTLKALKHKLEDKNLTMPQSKSSFRFETDNLK